MRAVILFFTLAIVSCKPIYDCSNRCERVYVGYMDEYTQRVTLDTFRVSLNEEWVSNPFNDFQPFITRQVAYNQFEILNEYSFYSLIEFTSTEMRIYRRVNGKLTLAYTFYE